MSFVPTGSGAYSGPGCRVSPKPDAQRSVSGSRCLDLTLVDMIQAPAQDCADIEVRGHVLDPLPSLSHQLLGQACIPVVEPTAGTQARADRLQYLRLAERHLRHDRRRRHPV